MMDHPKMVLGIALRFYINGVLQGAGRRYVQYVNRASVIGVSSLVFAKSSVIGSKLSVLVT